MDFISVEEASRDQIHVTYNGRIATFYGEISDIGFVVSANDIEWYPGIPATVEEKIQLMKEANQTFHGMHKLFFYSFYSNSTIYFDFKGEPLIQIQNNMILAEEFPCICSILTEINEFQDNAEYKRLQVILNGFITTKQMKKKLLPVFYKKQLGYRYECLICHTNWILVKPGTNKKGFFQKVEKSNS